MGKEIKKGEKVSGKGDKKKGRIKKA